MTENRRIFINIIATYGRSLYALAVGLLSGRWALMSLGEVDYGLNGLVGGLSVFISFFNGVLAGANARFYAFSIGAAQVAEDKNAALEECRGWFNTALSVHVVVPLFLIAVGYPLGIYAIKHWLTIPSGRIDACIWVFRFACVSCFVSMVNVPFSAMYGAKQYLAELTIYSFVTTTLNVIVLHYMVTHPGDWLARYAAWGCMVSVVPQIIICIRACYVFPECRVRMPYLWNWGRIRKLSGFAGWTMAGCLCVMLRTNGMSIVVNKFFGAAMNAAQALGITVQGHCNTLASAMQGAFLPVITQACGARDYCKMNEFVLRVSKFNILLSAVFMLPLALELPEVMSLWLKNPPAYSVGLCYCAMLHYLVSNCTVGHMIAVNAVGKLAMYHIVLVSMNIFTIPGAIVAGLIWHNVYMVMAVTIIFELLNTIGRVCFASKLAGTSIRRWLASVIVPLSLTLTLCLGIGCLPRFMMPDGFFRVCVTTVLCEAFFMPLTWFVLLSNAERKFVVEKIGPRVIKIRRLFA